MLPWFEQFFTFPLPLNSVKGLLLCSESLLIAVAQQNGKQVRTCIYLKSPGKGARETACFEVSCPCPFGRHLGFRRRGSIGLSGDRSGETQDGGRTSKLTNLVDLKAGCFARCLGPGSHL